MNDCKECGMPVKLGDYHPFAACLMFKGCNDSKIVNENLTAIRKDWYEIGVRYGKNVAAIDHTEQGATND